MQDGKVEKKTERKSQGLKRTQEKRMMEDNKEGFLFCFFLFFIECRLGRKLAGGEIAPLAVH